MNCWSQDSYRSAIAEASSCTGVVEAHRARRSQGRIRRDSRRWSSGRRQFLDCGSLSGCNCWDYHGDRCRVLGLTIGSFRKYPGGLRNDSLGGYNCSVVGHSRRDNRGNRRRAKRSVRARGAGGTRDRVGNQGQRLSRSWTSFSNGRLESRRNHRSSRKTRDWNNGVGKRCRQGNSDHFRGADPLSQATSTNQY